MANQTLRVFLSYWRRHKLQCAIAVLGIALGVAVVTAMDIANASALKSFRASVVEISGRATHQIVPAEGSVAIGIPDELLAAVVKIPGVKAAPKVESHGILLADPAAELPNTPADAREHPHGTAVVRIIGIDPLNDEPFRPFDGVSTDISEQAFEDWVLRDDVCVLPATLAKNLGVKTGDTIAIVASGQRHKLRIIATYTAKDTLARGSDDVVLMDIAAAQERFGRSGLISAIDLILPEGSDAERSDDIRAQLPAGIILQRPSERVGRTEALLSAFQLNLRALSLLALVVGIFLIHNTLTVAVLQRVPIIGTLRCLGESAGRVRRAVLLESLVLGFAGSLLGLAAVTCLAGIFLERVGGVVSDLYAHVGAFSIFFEPAALLKGLALGMLASVAGAYFPAREAGGVAPVQVLRRSRIEARASASMKWLNIAGTISLLLALALAFMPGSSPVPGLAAAFTLALGGALWAPAITRAFVRVANTPLKGAFGALALLASRGISANLSRTGLAVGALSLSLSMTLGVAMMVSSFRATLDRWMDQALNADIYIRPAGPSLLRLKSYIPHETIDALRARPDVAALDTFRGRELPLADGSPVMVVATDLRTTFSRGRSRFPFYKGEPDAALDGALNGGVLISESLARKQNLDVGGTLAIPGSDGGDALKISGIYYEYATDRGVVTMDASTYKKLFHDDRPNSISLYLKDGADVAAVREAVRREFGVPGGLYVFSNRTLRDEAFIVFDRTFAITRQLESLSLTVGLCGILSALLALLRERSTDFSLMRALGLTARGLARVIVLEGVLLGGAAFLVACVLGPALALLLIHVINVRAFGWTIFFETDALVFLRVGALALLMSALAGAYPALRARGMSISAGLRNE